MRSAEPSLAEVRQEMRELLDKQVNAQKESLKTVSTSPQKVCDENQRNKKKQHARKNLMLLMEGGHL